MRSLSFEYRFKSPLSAVWPAVSDTDRFNRALGFPSVTYRDEPQPDGTSRRFCKQARFGIELEYEELPFSWVHERSFRVERLYARGPVARLAHTCFLEPLEGGGCRARVIWDWDPRGGLNTMIAAWSVKHFALKPFQKVFAELDERIAREMAAGASVRPACVLGAARPASPDEQARIDELIPRVKEIYDSPLIARLAEAVKNRSDQELRRMQPLFYARTWSADTTETIDTFLAATRAGLLTMRWDVICPHCRGDKKNLASLEDVTERAFCAACNIDFDVDLDRGLEAVFTPHPQVRAVEEARYCLGGPGTTPHLFFQRLLAPGEVATVAVSLPEGRYRVRFSGEDTYRWIDVGSRSGSGRAIVQKARFGILEREIEGQDLSIDRSGAELTFENRAPRRVLVNIAAVSWAADALSAGEMIADQRFRDLFSGEVLAPGVKLGIESVTILFTDLVGSTAMYEALGDAPAFSLVWTHFDVLREIVSKHHGAIVKTIGDAIMAVFIKPEDALTAAGELHARVAPYCKERGHAHPVTLKIGMHEGPCIAVTLNERLDFFGSTVNLAARVEAQSKGGDIIASKTVADHTRDGEALRMHGWNTEAITAHCKGFGEPIPMLRFTPNAHVEENSPKPASAMSGARRRP